MSTYPNNSPMKLVTFWDRVKLLFTGREQNWDFGSGMLTIYKVRKGVVYILAQEPIEYGDCRNHQISRWD